jgi:hypothetical protein
MLTRVFLRGNPEKRKHSRHHQGGVMSRIAVVIAFVTALITSAFAQKAEIESVNAKWIDFFNKGDFAGAAPLYTDDASAFPPGSGLVKGQSGDRGNVEGHGRARLAIRNSQPST